MSDVTQPDRLGMGQLSRADWVLVLGLLGLGVFGAAAGGMGLFEASSVLTGAQLVPLLWRRQRPFGVALFIAAACLLQVFVVDGPIFGNIAAPIAVYSAAAFGTRFQSLTVVGIGLAGSVIGTVAWRLEHLDIGQQLTLMVTQAIFMAMFIAVAWALGDTVRRRKAVVARLEQQNAALARDQAQRSKLAAQGERAAIAREMHDVVAHSLAVVVVQADGALYAARAALDRPPAIGPDREALERAAQTLETLADTARTSLADTRKLVGVLREEGARAEFAPLQGLAYLDDLVQRVRDSGVSVQLADRGRIEDLPRDVDLAAYRVIQESLTNVMKHAGAGASVDVDLLRTPTLLLVRVTDDGVGSGRRGVAYGQGGGEHGGVGRGGAGRGGAGHGGAGHGGDGQGNGLLGMRERVEVLGGTVHAGPRAAGAGSVATRSGWEVVATIPVAQTGAAQQEAQR